MAGAQSHLGPPFLTDPTLSTNLFGVRLTRCLLCMRSGEVAASRGEGVWADDPHGNESEWSSEGWGRSLSWDHPMREKQGRGPPHCTPSPGSELRLIRETKTGQVCVCVLWAMEDAACRKGQSIPTAPHPCTAAGPPTSGPQLLHYPSQGPPQPHASPRPLLSVCDPGLSLGHLGAQNTFSHSDDDDDEPALWMQP